MVSCNKSKNRTIQHLYKRQAQTQPKSTSETIKITPPSWRQKVRYPTQFNGYYFARNNFSHKAISCRLKMFPRRNVDRSRISQGPNVLHANGNTYFSPLLNQIKCFICNNFGHKASECKSSLLNSSMHHTKEKSNQ